METTKRIVILLILVLLAASPAQSMEKAAERISNTREAGCLVKVTSDPAVFPLNIQTIEYLLLSSGVGGKAAREVLDASPDRIDDYIDIDYEEWLDSDSDSSGSLGLPPMDSRTGLSSGYEEGMDEYEEMMMEMERPDAYQAPSPDSPKFSGSSSVVRTTSRAQGGTGGYSSTRRTTASRTQPTTGVGSSSRGRSDRRGSYDAYYMSPPPQRTATAQVPAITANEETYLFSLQVHLPADVKPAAEEFMNALLTYLEQSLSDAFDAHRDRLRSQLRVADEEAGLAEETLRNMQDELRSISGSRALERNRILSDIGRLRQQIQIIKMDQDSHQISSDVTTRQIVEIEHKLQEQIAKDTVTKELEDILKLQQEHLQRTNELVVRGTVSPAGLADAEEKIARARIELAQRREQLSKSAGGNLIESLNRQLADLLLQKAQEEASLRNLEKQLSEAENLLDKADDYELLSLKADIAKQNLQEVILWRDRISRRMRMLQPPAVSIIGAE